MAADPFAGMVEDLFSSVLAVDAAYSYGAGPSSPVRAIIRTGIGDSTLFDRSAITETIIIDLRVSEVAAPEDGDTVEHGGMIYTITGHPRRSADRLVWVCETDGEVPHAP